MNSDDPEVIKELIKSSPFSQNHSEALISQQSCITKNISLPVTKRSLLKKQHPIIKPRPSKKHRVEAMTPIPEQAKPQSRDMKLNPSKCKHCVEGVMEYDTTIGQNFCSSCNMVDEINNLVEVPIRKEVEKFSNVSALKGPPVFFTRYQRKPPGQQQGLRKVEEVAQQYNLNPDSIMAVKTMFNDVYSTIKTKSIRFKEAVAGCCVYKELMNRQVPVLIRELLLVIDCRQKEFSKALKVVEEKFGKNHSMSKENLIRAVLKDAAQSPLGKEDFKDLLKKTEEILILAEQCWLCTGRSTVASVVACAFFAYKTQLVKVANRLWRTITFKEFCDSFGLSPHCGTATNRVRELTALFMKLGHSNLNLMYNGTKIPRKEIYLHIDNILFFSDEIIAEFLSLQNKTFENVTIPIDTFRRKRKRVNIPAESMTDEQAKYLNSLPDEELIGDSEMMEHIRTPKEVKFAKKLKKIVHLPLLDNEGKSYLYRDIPGYEQEAAKQELCGALLMMSSTWQETKD